MDAIQKDVSGEEVVPTEEQEAIVTEEPVVVEEPEKPILERDSVMTGLAAKLSAQRNGGKDREEDPVSAAAGAEKAEPDATETPTIPAVDPRDERVLLKVHGREIWKTQGEVDDAGGVAALQKRIAGDISLEEANRRQRELDQREQELNQREQQAKAPAQPATVATSDDIRKKAAQMAEDVVLGDTAKVTETLAEILSMGQRQAPEAAPFNTDEITNRIVSEADHKLAVKSAQRDFATQFKDVNESPIYRTYANEQTKKLMAENPNWTPAQILTEAGNRTRAVIKQANPAPSALETKKQIKQQTVDHIPRAAARKPQPVAQKPPKTQREIFEEMQSKRSSRPL